MEVAVNVMEREWRKKIESTAKMLKMTDEGRKEKKKQRINQG